MRINSTMISPQLNDKKIKTFLDVLQFQKVFKLHIVQKLKENK